MKSYSKNFKNNQTSKFTKFIFASISIGFTIISGWNGLFFYRILFGTSLAILLITTLEISRLACIYRYFRNQSSGSLTMTLYIMTASVCAFASVNSFTSEIIVKGHKNQIELNQNIHTIKSNFFNQTKDKEESLNRDVNYLQNNVAKYPNNKYWTRRLEVAQNQLESYHQKRKDFMDEIPKNPQEWIKIQSANLGLKLTNLSQENIEALSVTQALKELWGLEKSTAQKLLACILTIINELAILLLALLAIGKNSPKSTKAHSLTPKQILIEIQNKFDPEEVEKFIDQSKAHFQNTGSLPQLRNVNENLRPIKKYIEQFPKQTWHLFFQ